MSNLSLNQSRKKKKQFNYGEQIWIRKIPDEVENAASESSSKLHISVTGENIESNFAEPPAQDVGLAQSSSESIVTYHKHQMQMVPMSVLMFAIV